MTSDQPGRPPARPPAPWLDWIAGLVAVSCRHAWLVVLASLLLASGAGIYTAHHIAIDTDSGKLFSPKLPWRLREIAYDAAFPQQTKLIAVIVDGQTPELAESATAALAQRLAQDPAQFPHIERPDGGAFFETNGLLFLSTSEVEKTTQDIIAAQPLLGSLTADPSLRGVMDTLGNLADGVIHGQAKFTDVETPFRALADTLQTVEAGKFASLSWRNLIAGRPPKLREIRRTILVQPRLEFGALEPGQQASNAIRKAALDLGLTPDKGVRVRLTGSIPLSDEEFGSLADGALRNALITIAAVALLLWLGLRSARIIFAILATLAIGLVFTAAFGLLTVGRFNLISVAFTVLFVGLGVDLGIQFAVRYRAERHAQGDLLSALRAAGRGVGGSLVLAAAAIAAGFFAFLPTDYRGISELGLIAGTGMLIALFLSVTLLPALILILRPPGEPAEVGYRFLAPVDNFLLRRRRLVLIAAGAVAVACIALSSQLRFDFNPLNLRSSKVESVSTLLDLMQDPAATPYSTSILAPSLDQAQAIAAKLDKLPEVGQTITLASFIPSDQDAKLALIGDAAQLLDLTLNPPLVKPAPSDAENVAAMKRAAGKLHEAASSDTSTGAGEARHLAEALEALAGGDVSRRQAAEQALIPGLQTMLAQLRNALQAAPVTLANLPPMLKQNWLAADGRARIEVDPKGNANDNEVLRRFVAAVRSVEPEVAGSATSIQDSGRTVVEAFTRAGLGGLLAISIILVVVLRRVADVVLTLAPLCLSVLLTLGLSVLLDWPLNFANIIALPLLFGIGVAFNIYFVMAWRRGEANPLQSSLTRAIIFSALTTTAAFGTLCLSNHPGTASMGRLLALSLGCTLISALLFLPALLGPPPVRANASDPAVQPK
jgi:hopanoid biosynthesis associated RND transporter like protein HpnN